MRLNQQSVYKTVWEYILGNGAYVKSFGKKKSEVSKNNYFDIKLKSSPKKKIPDFDDKELVRFGKMVNAALKKEKVASLEFDKKLKAKEALLAKALAEQESDEAPEEPKKKTKKR